MLMILFDEAEHCQRLDVPQRQRLLCAYIVPLTRQLRQQRGVSSHLPGSPTWKHVAFISNLMQR